MIIIIFIDSLIMRGHHRKYEIMGERAMLQSLMMIMSFDLQETNVYGNLPNDKRPANTHTTHKPATSDQLERLSINMLNLQFFLACGALWII